MFYYAKNYENIIWRHLKLRNQALDRISIQAYFERTKDAYNVKRAHMITHETPCWSIGNQMWKNDLRFHGEQVVVC